MAVSFNASTFAIQDILIASNQQRQDDEKSDAVAWTSLLEPPFPYTCHAWSEDDLKKLHNGEPAPAVCTSHPDNVFTGGNNTGAPGCGTCSCCHRVTPTVDTQTALWQVDILT